MDIVIGIVFLGAVVALGFASYKQWLKTRE